MGRPVALKLDAVGLIHKTDVGGVALGLHGSGYENLILAGDWTKTDWNVGCIEAAVRRRMILPDLVLGRSGTNRSDFGRAIGPMTVATCSRRATASASDGCWSAFRITKAKIACPEISSFLPTTAASATDLWSTSADSTSVVEIRWPATFITSSTRPSSQR